MNTDHTPPAADGLPAGTLEAAEIGASRLNAWARTPQGRNFLAHALVQLARTGWLRTEPGEGFEPMRDREPAEPVAVLPSAVSRADAYRELEQRYREHARNSVHPDFRAAYAAVANDLRRMADEAQPGTEAAPYGCRWCGDEQHHHGSQWHPTAGLHQWAEPTTDQIRDRMTARRARRTP